MTIIKHHKRLGGDRGVTHDQSCICQHAQGVELVVTFGDLVDVRGEKRIQ